MTLRIEDTDWDQVERFERSIQKLCNAYHLDPRPFRIRFLGLKGAGVYDLLDAGRYQEAVNLGSDIFWLTLRAAAGALVAQAEGFLTKVPNEKLSVLRVVVGRNRANHWRLMRIEPTRLWIASADLEEHFGTVRRMCSNVKAAIPKEHSSKTIAQIVSEIEIPAVVVPAEQESSDQPLVNSLAEALRKAVGSSG